MAAASEGAAPAAPAASPVSVAKVQLPGGETVSNPWSVLASLVKVHNGFLQAYISVRDTVDVLMKANIAQGGGKGPWQVMFTGHSLGGALATLAAFELGLRRGQMPGVKGVTLYTLGSPRVGNTAFAQLFDSNVFDAWRLTNPKDAVPSVPRMLGLFCHSGRPVRLSHDGVPRIGRNSLEMQNAPRSGNRPSDEAIPFDEQYSDGAETEIHILAALTSGHGVSDHGGDTYLAMMTRTVQQALSSVQQKLRI